MIRFRKVCHEILCIVTFSMSLLTPRGSSWSPAHVHSRKGVYRAPGDGRCPPPTWTRASISYKLWSYSRYSAARSKFKTYVFPIGFPTVTAHYHFRCTNQHDNSLGNPIVNSRTQKWQNPTIFLNEPHYICCNFKVYRSWDFILIDKFDVDHYYEPARAH